METPACEPHRRMLAREIAAMRMKSKARVMNAAKVDAKGTSPRTCMPTAAATICCSAMYISKKRSAAVCLKSSACVELLTSPSRTTTSARAAPSAASASPYAFRVASGSRYVFHSGLRGAGRFGGCHGSGFSVGNVRDGTRSEEHTSELQSQSNLVCRLLLEKKKTRHPDVS